MQNHSWRNLGRRFLYSKISLREVVTGLQIGQRVVEDCPLVLGVGSLRRREQGGQECVRKRSQLSWGREVPATQLSVHSRLRPGARLLLRKGRDGHVSKGSRRRLLKAKNLKASSILSSEGTTESLCVLNVS